MKQKVGVITFHEANNYGAVLQAVALQITLNKIGADAYLINYRPETDYGFKLKLSPRNIPYIPFLNAKKRKFNHFLNTNSKLTKIATNIEQLKVITKSFDAIITGSDQVFNPKWRNGDLNYLLSFADPNQRYSYAASFGISELPLEWENKITPLLQNYNTISVREASAIELIENMGLKGRIDCDPVLLLSKDEWIGLSKTNRLEPYLLLYTLEQNDELLKFARKIAKEKNLQIVQLTDSLRKTKGDIHYFSYKSPEEFIGAFNKADYIVTNSFHGLAFSTLLEKDFTVFLQNKNGAPNARLTDFVNKYQIVDRVFGQGGELLKEHDFEGTRESIKQDVNKSLEYLKTFGESTLARSKYECAYCGACSNACRQDAITYKQDSEGHKYPYIDKTKCINCGACEKVCPYTSVQFKNNIIKSFGYANQTEDRLNSRSGGLFFTIAKEVISQNGIVYGAIIDESNNVKHTRATTLEQVRKMQKSKYVSSDAFESNIKDIVKDLMEGKYVFVSGTPCFINAVQNICKFKNIDTKNLLTMDLVCHGIPSPKVFKSYIDSLENKYGKVNDFQFRDKEKGWNTHFESYKTADGNKHYSQEYADIFYSHAFHRPSCYNCMFTNLNRPSDITGADFWGGSNIKEFSDNKGASLVLVNTEKGKEIFENIIKKDAIYKEIDINNFMQAHLSEPLKEPKNRKDMWDAYFDNGFKKASKKATGEQNKIRRKNKFKATIVKVLKKMHIKK